MFQLIEIHFRQMVNFFPDVTNSMSGHEFAK